MRQWARRDLAILSLCGIGGYGVARLLQANAPIGQDLSGNNLALALLRDPRAPTSGPADADLTALVFTDYRCPACRRAAPELDAAVNEDGGVRLAFKDWPILGPDSMGAARIALAADFQGLYRPIHLALMEEPRRLTPDVLRSVAESVGVDWDRLQRDLSERAQQIELTLLKTKADVFALGVQGTPTFLIGPWLISAALSRKDFLRAFRKARERQGTSRLP